MNLETARDFLLWCTVINYAVLILWFFVFKFAHDWVYRLHNRWFRLPVEQFDVFHYAGMSIYKMSIFLFNLVPYVALCILR